MSFYSYFPDEGAEPVSWEEYLRARAVPHYLIDGFIAGPGWARFDAELGYVLRDSTIAWGTGGTLAAETFDADGGRETLRYPGRRPRIACYGDEFTEGIQVNDGETWQEYLSAHLREPIANYGVGGYGVYQAYRRMIREERSHPHTQVIVLGITGPAVVRSVTRSHWVSTVSPWWNHLDAGIPIFHGTPWPSIEMDLDAGRLVERENPLRTPASLDRMCDPEWMVDAFRSDLGSRLLGVSMGFVGDLDRAATDRLADALGTRVDWDGYPRIEARRLLNRYGQAATIAVLDRARDAAAERGIRLLVVLDFTSPGPRSRMRDGDDLVLAHLVAGGFATVDVNEMHWREHERSTLSWDDYLAQYWVDGNPDFVRHYNPRGNHFFAYAVKDGLLELLESKPLPYRAGGRDPIGPRDRTAVSQPDLGGHEQWLAPFLRELDRRFAEPWGVESLTRLARRSRSALYRDFQAAMRMSPMEYVKRLRLDEAARLFLSTDLTIGAVAERVGIGSGFHLSREFARRFGQSPTEYRRSRRPGAARPA